LSLQLDHESENPGIFDGLGQCYHTLGKYDEALTEFESALKNDPFNLEFLKNRA